MLMKGWFNERLILENWNRQMMLHPLDSMVLLIYLLAMVIMGLYFARRNTNTEEYFVGGRSFQGWVIGLSMVGTSISSITFLALPGDAYKTAWLRFLPYIMLIPTVVIAAHIFLLFFRRRGMTSAYEYLEYRFGPSIRIYGTVAFVFAQVVRVSMIMYLLSLVLHKVTGISPTLCVLIGGTFVALYTIIGGFAAIIWTDVIQTIVLIVGGFLSLAVIVDTLPGGLGQIFSVAAAEGKFAFAEFSNNTLQPVSWDLSLSEKSGSMMLLVGLIHFLTEYSGNQNVVQRYCASKSSKEARKAMYICAFSSIPIWSFYMFLGTALFVFFQQFPTPETTAMLTGAGSHKAEEVLPFFIMHHIPPGVAGLVMAAALAAAMSSLDSSINAVATVTIVDIVRRHLVKDREDHYYLRVARWISMAMAVFMIGGAILLIHTETKTLQDTATILASLLGAGLLGMYLLGFLTTKGDARAVWIGIMSTLLFSCWTIMAKYAPDFLPVALHVPFDLYYTGIIGNFLLFLIGFTVGTLLSDSKRDLHNLTIWRLHKESLE